MNAQLDLFAAKAPEVSSGEVAAFMDVLRGGEWKTARQCGARDESAKRSLREIAEASEGQIISGQRGYKLTLEATLPEIDATIWLRNQGRKMIRRWLQIQRVRHRYFSRGVAEFAGAKAHALPPSARGNADHLSRPEPGT